MSVTPWNERLPQRFLSELKAVEASDLSLRFERFPGGVVGWKGTVEVDGASHFLRIVYPPDFPARPPSVHDTEPFTDTPTDDSATFHQMGDGSLCLYALGDSTDAWHPELTVVDVVDRYTSFRRTANAGGHVDVHGPRPNLPGLRLASVVVLTPSQFLAFRIPDSWGWVHLGRRTHGDARVAKLVTNPAGSLSIGLNGVTWERVRLAEGPDAEVPWLPLPVERWKARCGDRQKLAQLLAERLPESVVHRLGGNPRALIVDADGAVPCAALFESTPHPLLSAHILRTDVVFDDLDDLLFQRVDGAMSGREALSRWRVVIIGLGSLGGSVALHLARAGVARFDVFDPDLVRPENICRHVAGLAGVYLPKAFVVARLLLDRNPSAEVRSFMSSPLWDGANYARRAFVDALADPDTLIVVTTADEDVERGVNELALLHGRPVVYASVMGRAEYGRVQRVIPGETPCYACIAPQQRERPDAFFRAPDVAGDPTAELPGYRQPGVPGVGIDVEAVALHAARLVLQTLGRLGGGSPDYPDASGHHLVCSNRESADFDHALQVRWERYVRRVDCPSCGDAQHSPVSAEVRDELVALERALSAPERLTTTPVPIVGASPPPEETP